MSSSWTDSEGKTWRYYYATMEVLCDGEFVGFANSIHEAKLYGWLGKEGA